MTLTPDQQRNLGYRVGAAANQAAQVVGNLYNAHGESVSDDAIVAQHSKLLRAFIGNMETIQAEIESATAQLVAETGAIPAPSNVVQHPSAAPAPVQQPATAAPAAPPAPAAPAPPAPVAPAPAPGVQADPRDTLWREFQADWTNGNQGAWYDNRADKQAGAKSPKFPDFKRKSDGEGLWVDDKKNPAWVVQWLGA